MRVCRAYQYRYATGYESTYTLKCLFYNKIVNNQFRGGEALEIRFSQLSRKISMLLHKSNINVAFAVILWDKKSLYDPQEPWYQNKKGGVA